MIKFTIITLFKEALEPYLKTSMMWKATEKGLAEFNFVNLRDFGLGPHKSVDDTVYGGGDGMLLRCEPVFAAVESVKAKDPEARVILPTPVGEIWNQVLARVFASGQLQSLFSRESGGYDRGIRGASPVTTGASDPDPRKDVIELPRTMHYIILCPHYEGYDERILSIIDYKLSLGRYVLTGGELPALIFIDSIVRLLPCVLGGETSAEIESFSDGNNIEYPQYTKPETFRDMNVPEVLLSGHHGKVDEWRQKMSGTVED
jgi:tRNA (guanine37-N1)-methyltransferase